MSIIRHTPQSFLASLEAEAKQIEDVKRKNELLLEASEGKSHTCIQYVSSNYLNTENEMHVFIAKCPRCKNADVRFMLDDDDKAKSSFVVTETYCGSGVDLMCLCCKHEFKFCTGRSLWKEMNCIRVPLSFTSRELGVDNSKYIRKKN